jgi:hypothetical protein
VKFIDFVCNDVPGAALAAGVIFNTDGLYVMAIIYKFAIKIGFIIDEE